MNKGILFACVLPLYGCSHAPMETVDYVDLDRFMGTWYVVANIPTFLEEDAHNAVEYYERNDDGSIATTFTFHEDDFDGPLKEYNPTGYIEDEDSNALWGMQFVWPIRADYRIVYLDDAYSHTVIGRRARDYVWVMSRKPQFSDADFSKFKRFIESIGYDAGRLQRVPQQWPVPSGNSTGNTGES